MDQFAKLTQEQHQQQHQHANKHPKWFCPNVLRYYILIHDVLDAEENKWEITFIFLSQLWFSHLKYTHSMLLILW